MRWIFSLALLLSLLDACPAAQILFYHHVSTYSHRVVSYPLADALARRGHNVTFLSPFQHRGPHINPNVTEIVPKKLAATTASFLASDFDINFRIQKVLPDNVFAYFPTGIKGCVDVLQSEELNHFLETTTHLDLVVLDNCLSECSMAIVHKYGAKHITYNTLTMVGSEHDVLGVTPESASVPELELFAPKNPMTFLERVKNTLTSMVYRYYQYTWYFPQIDQIIRKYCRECGDMPFIDDLYRNTSLVLYMGDIITDYARALPPLVVKVGGIHCLDAEKGKELPADIKQFIAQEDNNDGFVYISLGSLVVSSNLPEAIKQMFFRTMVQFPNLRFLWKWNGEIPKNVPANLKLGTWFPQNDILAHPKLKAFVTQSGRPSTLEALCAGVPMIAIPVIGDQDAIANRMNEMGANVLLEIGDITPDNFKAALEQVVYDPRMKERIVQLRTLLKDQPMSPLDTAVWWTEYVLRHKDTDHLKPAGFNLAWYERRLLDVWAFLFLAILFSGLCIGFIVITALKFVIKIFLPSSSMANGAKPGKKKKM